MRYYFKYKDVGVYICIDADAHYMTTITATSGKNSIDHNNVELHVDRQLAAFTSGHPGIKPITEAEFFHVYYMVWEVLDTNHMNFFNFHFQL